MIKFDIFNVVIFLNIDNGIYIKKFIFMYLIFKNVLFFIYNLVKVFRDCKNLFNSCFVIL